MTELDVGPIRERLSRRRSSWGIEVSTAVKDIRELLAEVDRLRAPDALQVELRAADG